MIAGPVPGVISMQAFVLHLTFCTLAAVSVPSKLFCVKQSEEIIQARQRMGI